MSFSSTSLIHVTDSLEKLCSILKEGFRVKYCFEKVESENNKNVLEAAFPMVCFCDMPLSGLKLQLSAYGKFGIGLTKEWGNKHKLNPVIYFDKHSRIVHELIHEFNQNKNQLSLIPNDFNTYILLMKIISFSKNYEGKLITEKRRIDRYRFSDEREWRFVPTTELLIKYNIPPFVDSKKYQNNKKNFNKFLEPIRVPFEPDDVRYLIVENDKDINPLIHNINKQNFEPEVKNRLMSRIVTFNQIENDM